MNIKKFHILSNVNTGKKIALVFLMFFISSSVLLTGMIKGISDIEEKYCSENENTVLSSTEQYISMSIENIVSIAKTIYTNNSLYSLLNTEYETPAEYYDALYHLKENNSLIITENQNIKKYTIYTDNSTIISGGNIIHLSNVRNEAWYQRFIELNKAMIVYCDDEKQSFSLIRKLDYDTINTGESYLKIDFNNAVIENYFDNLDFGGKLYVINGGVLIFSNTDAKSVRDIKITPEYKCHVKNYYTSELEYYAVESKHSIPEIISGNISYIIPFVVMFAVSAIISVFVIINITSRSKKFTMLLRSESELAKLESSFGGNDEIGRMFSECIMIFDKLQFSQREYNKCNDALEKSYSNSRCLLLQALHLDTKILCFEKYPIENNGIDFSVPVPIELEFKMLEKHLKNRKIKNYKVDMENFTDKISVLPFSVIMIADDLVHCSDEKIFISAYSDGKCLNISFKTDAEISSGKILKLRALFEDYPHQTDFDFHAGFIYNHYLRIKNYYENNVSIIINNDDDFCFTVIFVL